MRATFAVILFTIVLLTFDSSALQAQQNEAASYSGLTKRLAKGWNTWNVNSMLSHVLLPQGFAVNLTLKSNAYLQQTLPGVNRPDFVRSFQKGKDRRYSYLDPINRPEQIIPGMRSDDGSYTSLQINWNGTESRVETATVGDDLVVLVTPTRTRSKTFLVIEAGFLWNRPGEVVKRGALLQATSGRRTFRVGTAAPVVVDNTVPTVSRYLSVPMTEPIGVYTGATRTLGEITKLVRAAEGRQAERAAKFGKLGEAFKAMQGVLAWNTIYDPENERVLTPVSRLWAALDGGWVLFDWDTYFAAYMASLFNKDIAYANAIAITKEITKAGFIPNRASTYGRRSEGTSQPPVGSFVVKEIYRRYRETWFVKIVYDDLVRWNRWWPQHRDNMGFLSFGSDSADGHPGSWQGAAYESGLDNTPMYDKVPFNKKTSMLELADVGLMSFYILDCESLAQLARVMGKPSDEAEFIGRANKYRSKLATLWNEPAGMYLNRRTDLNASSARTSPTNFYPLFIGLPEVAKAERMINEHLENPSEYGGEYVIPSAPRNDPAFTTGEYWRGRIWGPMNFLVYLGLRQYAVPKARTNLAEKSLRLFLQSWKEDGSVYENYSAKTGRGDDVQWSDSYYHWGALLGFMSFVEAGFVPPPEPPLPL